MRLSHLLDARRVAETPPLPRVRLADVVARIAASVFGGFSAVARAAIVGRVLLAHLLNVVVELADLRARDSRSCSCETSLGDIVRDVAL